MVMTDEQKAVAFATIMPGVGFVAGGALWFKESLGLRDHFMTCKKPKWAITDEKVMFGVDTVAQALAMYGGYLVYKKGGFDYPDTRLACALYAGMFTVGTAPVMAAWIQKDYVKTYYGVTFLHAFEVATMLCFFGIDRKAGLAMLPMAVWGYFQMELCKSIADLN